VRNRPRSDAANILLIQICLRSVIPGGQWGWRVRHPFGSSALVTPIRSVATPASASPAARGRFCSMSPPTTMPVGSCLPVGARSTHQAGLPGPARSWSGVRCWLVLASGSIPGRMFAVDASQGRSRDRHMTVYLPAAVDHARLAGRRPIAVRPASHVGRGWSRCRLSGGAVAAGRRLRSVMIHRPTGHRRHGLRAGRDVTR
jgi:hypothetical protein